MGASSSGLLSLFDLTWFVSDGLLAVLCDMIQIHFAWVLTPDLE